jgi:hypothetical protein
LTTRTVFVNSRNWILAVVTRGRCPACQQVHERRLSDDPVEPATPAAAAHPVVDYNTGKAEFSEAWWENYRIAHDGRARRVRPGPGRTRDYSLYGDSEA